jgi:hypothetical protein
MAISSFKRAGLSRVVSVVPPNADFSNTATGTYTDGGVSYKYVTFTGAGSLVVTKTGMLDYLIVGAGGGGTSSSQNGLGHGGYVVFGSQEFAAGSYSVAVGSGVGYTSGFVGNIGGTSSLGSLAAPGGGASPGGASGANITSSITGTSVIYARGANNSTPGGGANQNTSANGIVVVRVRT